jgi:3-oxoacyl-[acyl-carrier-protein] synthase-1
MSNTTPRRPLAVTAYTLTSALGAGVAATIEAIQAQRGGLTPHAVREGGSCWTGKVEDIDTPLPEALRQYDSRAARMMAQAIAQDDFLTAVAQARERYGAHRVGCFIGTIGGGQNGIERYYIDNRPKTGDLGPVGGLGMFLQLHSVTDYSRQQLEIAGPMVTVSTACSSSAKVFCLAQRYIESGLCDAAVVGGVDFLNESFIFGFRSLGLLSGEPCRPWDRRRDGLSLGEAAGFALLERRPVQPNDISLLGCGDSVDGYHMTAPHPDGIGAESAMRSALRNAGLEPADIDYINLHGSGTPANDSSEDAAILTVFGRDTPCSATKGWTGHTQGAAGITEAVLSMLSIKYGLIPATLNCAERDAKLNARIVLTNTPYPVNRVLSNSFGFAGNNCSLIFGAAT